MEEQLNTRSIMTGWVALTAFLAAYLLHRCPAQILGALQQSNYTTLLVAVLSTPFIGWGIGALVIAVYYLVHRHPYHGQCRERTKEWVAKRLQDYDKPELAALVRAGVVGDDLFSYLMNSANPQGLIEWGRRRHTARFVGWNWLLAALIGGAVGSLAGLKYGWYLGGSHVIPAVFIILATMAVVFNGIKAAREVERVERLWLEDFIAKQKEDRSEPAQASNQQVLLRKEALEKWANSLSGSHKAKTVYGAISGSIVSGLHRLHGVLPDV